jgi:hypothetical protein
VPSRPTLRRKVELCAATRVARRRTSRAPIADAIAAIETAGDLRHRFDRALPEDRRRFIEETEN